MVMNAWFFMAVRRFYSLLRISRTLIRTSILYTDHPGHHRWRNVLWSLHFQGYWNTPSSLICGCALNAVSQSVSLKAGDFVDMPCPLILLYIFSSSVVSSGVDLLYSMCSWCTSESNWISTSHYCSVYDAFEKNRLNVWVVRCGWDTKKLCRK